MPHYEQLGKVLVTQQRLCENYSHRLCEMTVKSFVELKNANELLKGFERDVALSREVNVSISRLGLRAFVEDCQQTMLANETMEEKEKGRLKGWVFHWRLFEEGL